MLPDLLKVDERVLEPLADGGHTTEGSSLELLALEERLAVFEKAHIVARNRLNQRLCSRELAESNAEVVRIVEGVEEIAVERVDVGQARESFDGGGEALDKGLGRVLDFSRIKGSDSANLEAGTDLGREPLCLCQLSCSQCSVSLALERRKSQRMGAGRYALEWMKLEAYLLCVLDRTMSKNSWLVGTAGMSFH